MPVKIRPESPDKMLAFCNSGCSRRKHGKCGFSVFFRTKVQKKRDDNKNKICAFQGGLGRGAGRKIVQNAIFQGKRHDNKILKVKCLLSRNFVVMAQAPKGARKFGNAEKKAENAQMIGPKMTGLGYGPFLAFHVSPAKFGPPLPPHPPPQKLTKSIFCVLSFLRNSGFYEILGLLRLWPFGLE